MNDFPTISNLYTITLIEVDTSVTIRNNNNEALSYECNNMYQTSRIHGQ